MCRGKGAALYRPKRLLVLADDTASAVKLIQSLQFGGALVYVGRSPIVGGKPASAGPLDVMAKLLDSETGPGITCVSCSASTSELLDHGIGIEEVMRRAGVDVVALVVGDGGGQGGALGEWPTVVVRRADVGLPQCDAAARLRVQLRSHVIDTQHPSPGVSPAVCPGTPQPSAGKAYSGAVGTDTAGLAHLIHTACPRITARDAVLYDLMLRVLFFHCSETLFKEKLFNLPGFRFVEALSLLNPLLWTIFAYLALSGTAGASSNAPGKGAGGGFKRKTPLPVYIVLGCLAATSYVMTNRATLHLNVITQIVLKSSKLLWVMAARAIFLPQKLQSGVRQWAGAVCIVSGVVLFSTGIMKERPRTDATFEGLLCLCVSLACDAAVYVIEEGICFGRYDAHPNELIFYMKMFALLPSAGFLVASGRAVESAEYLTATSSFWMFALGYAAMGFMGTRSLLTLIERFDGTTAATVCSFRKVMSILLSFLLFPRPFSASFCIGAAMIIGGASLTGRKAPAPPPSQPPQLRPTTPQPLRLPPASATEGGGR